MVFSRVLALAVGAALLVAISVSAEPTTPSPEPELFAPGVVSKPDRHEFGITISADGSEVYFGVDTGEGSEIWTVEKSGEDWGPSRRLLSHGTFSFNDPTLDPTGQRLYFISTETPPGRKATAPLNADIWYLQREESGWSSPIHTGPVLNTDADEYYISFTDEGDLYFASNAGAERKGNYDLYFSPRGLHEPAPRVRLGAGVNTGAYEADIFIAPDGSYAIFAAGRRGGLGRGDLYISFRGEDGAFEKSKNLGAPINTPGHELCPFVSKDGRDFYYTSNQDIYRISTDALWIHR